MDKEIFLSLVAILAGVGIVFLTEIIKGCGHIEDKLKARPAWNSSEFPRNIGAIDAHNDWAKVVRAFYIELSACKVLPNRVVIELVATVATPVFLVAIVWDWLSAIVLVGPLTALLLSQVFCLATTVWWVFRTMAFKRRRDQLDELVH